MYCYGSDDLLAQQQQQQQQQQLVDPIQFLASSY
jgi:hypothetical protein